MTPEEAAGAIERFLAEKSSYPQEWNDFAETPQEDPRVEQYRNRCDRLSPLVNRAGDMDDAAVAELKSMIEELRSMSTSETVKVIVGGEQKEGSSDDD